MNIQAQKIRLIERIAQVENQTIIDQIHAILEQNEEDFSEQLTEEQRESVQRGLSQLKSGHTVPQEEMEKIYKKWL